MTMCSCTGFPIDTRTTVHTHTCGSAHAVESLHGDVTCVEENPAASSNSAAGLTLIYAWWVGGWVGGWVEGSIKGKSTHRAVATYIHT